MREVLDWFNWTPGITKILVVLPLFIELFVGPLPLYLDFDLIRSGQWYRMITCFFLFHPAATSMGKMFDLYNVYRASNLLAVRKFKNVADYLFYFVVIEALMLNLLYLFDGIYYPFQFSSLLTALMFTESRVSKGTRVQFLFFDLKAEHLPLVSIAMGILDSDLRQTFLGMFAGYAYCCLENKDLGPAVAYLRNAIKGDYLLPATYIDDGYIPAPRFLSKTVEVCGSYFTKRTGNSNTPSSKGIRLGTLRDRVWAAETQVKFKPVPPVRFNSNFQGKGHRLGS